MKVKYRFCNEGIEVEVNDYWVEILNEFDRLERNNDHRETRGDRKYQSGPRLSFDAMDYEGQSFSDDTDLLRDLIRKENCESVRRAVSELLPQQQVLVWSIFEGDAKIADIARECGVTGSAIRDRLKKIYRQLRIKLK